ncbi:MAG: hypothetical protein Q9175_001203 [Cornicularia normoerica]
MSIIAFLLTTLAILSPILSSPIKPREWGSAVSNGVLTSDYVPGFIGERPITGPDGDYLRATFCYCKTPFDPAPRGIEDGNGDGQDTGGGNGIPPGEGIEPGEILQGHFWRYEYFNYHYNATYFLNHYCMEDAFPKDKYGCGHDGPGPQSPPTPVWTPPWDYAFTYSPLPGHDLHSWSIYKKQTDLDFIFFGRGGLINQQRRRLGQDQGLIKMPQEYADEKCSHYCDTELMLPMDPTMRSHGELYNDVDDMCDRCN